VEDVDGFAVEVDLGRLRQHERRGVEAGRERGGVDRVGDVERAVQRRARVGDARADDDREGLALEGGLGAVAGL
jgi:hypothetical protein